MAFRSTIILLLFCFLYTCISLARAEDGTVLVKKDCGTLGNFSSNGRYSSNLASLLSFLLARANSSLYYGNSTGSTSDDTVYGMFQCQGDQTFPECSLCVSAAINIIAEQCPNSFVSRVSLYACILVYQRAKITADSFTVKDTLWNPNNDTDSAFISNRNAVVGIVANQAPYSPVFYNATYRGDDITERVYAVGQCSGYLSQSDCAQCLSKSQDVQKFNTKGGRVYHGTNCYYRFEANLFYNVLAPSPPPSSSTGGSVNKTTLVSSILGSCLVVAFFWILWGFWMRKKARNKIAVPLSETTKGSTEHCSLELRPDLHHETRLFSLEELEKATRNYDAENKLGEGGFGSVYKGVLENGQIVAIKKLSHSSYQGERQFLSEVKLLKSVQHRNLIMLIGCCIEGSERLLIYEYVPNLSLDRHLFDAERSTSLSWSIRRHIIIGTAKGLSYLHEDSQVRIVHRDIKAANILLDENLHPKIADFGLARLFAVNLSHITTRVAGTLGYLAPEYAIHGQLTEKADVFSYGLVVLEILSGRRNTDTCQPADRHQLLHWTWELYKDQRQLELIDPLVRDHYIAEEAIRMVHVALLCTQAVAVLRPAMSKVVSMLMSRSEILDMPTNPPFVDSSIVELESLTASHGDHHGVYLRPPVIIGSQQPASLNSASVYSPLMTRRSQDSAASISDVPEPR